MALAIALTSGAQWTNTATCKAFHSFPVLYFDLASGNSVHILYIYIYIAVIPSKVRPYFHAVNSHVLVTKLSSMNKIADIIPGRN